MKLKRAEELFRLRPNYSLGDITCARERFIQGYCPDESKYPDTASKFMAETEKDTSLLNQACSKRNPSGATNANRNTSKEYVTFPRRTAWSSDITEEEYEQIKMEAENTETADERLEVARSHFVLCGYNGMDAIQMKLQMSRSFSVVR